jgi:S-adenosylmethionine decarboxylase
MSLGNHVFMDVINFVDEDILHCSQWFEAVMNDAIAMTTMKNMFSKMIMLDVGTINEGFTSVILLNESHITAHSYTRKGILAVDVFTCGQTNPSAVLAYIRNRILDRYPNVIISNFANHRRFITNEYSFNQRYE